MASLYTMSGIDAHIAIIGIRNKKKEEKEEKEWGLICIFTM